MPARPDEYAPTTGPAATGFPGGVAPDSRAGRRSPVYAGVQPSSSAVVPRAVVRRLTTAS